jgi:ribosome-associated protein
MKIQVTSYIMIDARDITLDFVRSSAPGGQNVNKVSSAVELRFDSRAADLEGPVRERLERLAGRRLTQDGVIVLKAQRFRTQERNRADAMERLFALVAKAAEPPAPRFRTRPTRASKERRLEGKRQLQAVKRTRQAVRAED